MIHCSSMVAPVTTPGIQVSSRNERSRRTTITHRSESFCKPRSSPSQKCKPNQEAKLPPPRLVWMHNTLRLKGSCLEYSIEVAKVFVSFDPFHRKGKGSSCEPRSQLQQAHTWAPGPRQCGRLSIRVAGELCGRTKASVVQAWHRG